MKNKTFTISEKKLKKIIKRVIDNQETPCFGRRPYDEVAEKNGL